MCLQLLLNLNLGEGFNDIALLNIVEVDETDTALEASLDFLGVILEALERLDATRPDDGGIAKQAIRRVIHQKNIAQRGKIRFTAAANQR